MAAVVAEFFQVIGVDMIPPDTLAELIPYLITVVTGVSLVSGVFGILGRLVEIVFSFRRL